MEFRKNLKYELEDAGYEVATAGDGPDALRYIERHGLPYLILVDLGLPTMNGFDLLERLKPMGDLPVIILSNEKREESVVRGINHYADDFIVKPVSPREVAVRVGRVLSRIPDFSYAQGPILRVDDSLSIDFVHSKLLIGSRKVTLTPIETRLLSILIKYAGRYVGNEQLIARGWPGEGDGVSEETVRVHVSRLRRKLAEGAAGMDYIQNERGSGYRFQFPERPEE